MKAFNRWFIFFIFFLLLSFLVAAQGIQIAPGGSITAAGGTIVVGGAVTNSGTITNSGTLVLTVSSNFTNSGTFVAGSSTHKIGENWTNTGTFTATGSTIEFNGAGAGNIGVSNFDNVIFSGAGIKIATGILGIAGNVTISNNFTAGAFSHTVSGNWTKSGTFTATGSTINFNGASASNIGPGNFNNIIISGAGTKNGLGAITATGNFNLIAGQFILNNATSYNISIAGNLSQTGGVFDFNKGTSGLSSLYLGGNLTQTTGTATFTTSGAGAPNGFIIFNGPGTQTISLAQPDGTIWVVYSVPVGNRLQLLSNIALNSANGVSQAGFQGEIRVNGTLDMGTSTVVQSGGVSGTAVFTLNSGATLITANSGGISGAVSPTNMTTTYSSGANYEFRGASMGTFTTTPTAFTVNNLIFNSAYGFTLASTPLSVVSNLSLLGSSAVTLAGETSVGGNLSIANGCALTISPAIALNVAGTISNNAGTSGLIIKSSSTLANGTLIFHNDYLSPVPATVEMYSKAYKDPLATVKYKWQFFGIPVRTIVANPAFYGSYVRQMYESATTSTQHWVQLQNESVLNSFTGYEITQESPKTLSFQGDLENKDYVSGQLSYTTGASFPGQHLIGNPYTAAIDISKIVFGDQMLKTVYLFNSGSLSDWMNLPADSSITSYINNTPGQYISVPQVLAGAEGLQHQIPSMQAFLVKASTNDAAATVSIPYSTVNTVVKNTTLQRSRSTEKIYSLINVRGKKYGDRMWLFSDPYCSHNFDNGWDGEKFFGSALAPQIYAMEADGDYQVNSVNDLNNTDIGFLAGVDSSYTLTVSNHNVGLQYASIYLLDLLENKFTDLTPTGANYAFTAIPTGTPVKRFKILTRPTNAQTPDVTSADTPNGGQYKLKIFSSLQSIFVHNLSDLPGDLMLYDISGQLIQKMQFNAKAVTTLPFNLPAGIYLAKGLTGNEEVTERLIFR